MYAERVTAPDASRAVTVRSASMRLRKAVAVAPAVLCLALGTGCTDSGGAGTGPADAVAGGYRLPEGAPQFCAQLADGEALEDLPTAVGRLLVDPEDTQEAWRLTEARGALEDVRDALRRTDRHQDLEAALDEVIDALTLAAAGPLTDGTVRRMVAGLDAVGAEAQPICELPV